MMNDFSLRFQLESTKKIVTNTQNHITNMDLETSIVRWKSLKRSCGGNGVSWLENNIQYMQKWLV